MQFLFSIGIYSLIVHYLGLGEEEIEGSKWQEARNSYPFTETFLHDLDIHRPQICKIVTYGKHLLTANHEYICLK